MNIDVDVDVDVGWRFYLFFTQASEVMHSSSQFKMQRVACPMVRHWMNILSRLIVEFVKCKPCCLNTSIFSWWHTKSLANQMFDCWKELQIQLQMEMQLQLQIQTQVQVQTQICSYKRHWEREMLQEAWYVSCQCRSGNRKPASGRCHNPV